MALRMIALDKQPSGEAPFKEQAQYLLQYAILAPSTHNSQPWKFYVHENSRSVDFRLDLTKQLPQADPDGRDMLISLGACVETFIQAAAAYGLSAVVQSTDAVRLEDVVTTVTLSGTYNRRDLSVLNAILGRRNYRGPSQIDDTKIYRLQKSLIDIETQYSIKKLLCSDRLAIEQAASLTAEGIEHAYADKQFRREISSWINPNWSKKKTGIPGYALTMSGLLSFVFPKVIPFVDVGAKLAKLNKKSFMQASGMCILGTESEASFSDLVNTGRAAVCIMLRARQLQLQSSVYVAAIEMAGLQNQLKSKLELSFVPQFLFTLIYPVTDAEQQLRFTPRQELEQFFDYVSV